MDKSWPYTKIQSLSINWYTGRLNYERCGWLPHLSGVNYFLRWLQFPHTHSFFFFFKVWQGSHFKNKQEALKTQENKQVVQHSSLGPFQRATASHHQGLTWSEGAIPLTSLHTLPLDPQGPISRACISGRLLLYRLFPLPGLLISPYTETSKYISLQQSSLMSLVNT